MDVADCRDSMTPDLQQFLALDVPAVEIVVRGVVLYLLVFVLLRRMLWREGLSFDFGASLALVLIADASHGALLGDTPSLLESALLTVSLLGCHLLVRTARTLRHRAVRFWRRRMARGLQHLSRDLPTSFTERTPS
jgi:hypothetical protein